MGKLTKWQYKQTEQALRANKPMLAILERIISKCEFTDKEQKTSGNSYWSFNPAVPKNDVQAVKVAILELNEEEIAEQTVDGLLNIWESFISDV
jgi:hypothetical protein